MAGLKILVCGKGGVGKSVVSTLIAKELARRGKKVLFVDSDESNMGTHMYLGLPKPRDFIGYLGGRKEVKSTILKPLEEGREVNPFREMRIDDLPEEYVASKGGNIKMIVIGKIQDFGEGCACPMGAVARELLKSLKLGDDEYVVVDTDAGIEHFGRGVEEGSDVIVVVMEPNHESIKLAEKIAEMSRKIGKKVVRIGNKVDESLKGYIKADAYLPYKKEIRDACLLGKEIPLVDEAKEIVDAILKAASQP
ncbi:ATP-binding protein [Stetteria hydrogenophila]